ncbi:MAG: DNA-protecting protein DprA [Deltaproteobacteria bacterium]|nr:DNA-protecting protein DprA [Deltaproteobacteria bacterium]
MRRLSDQNISQVSGLVAARASAKSQILYAALIREHSHAAALWSRPELCQDFPELFRLIKDLVTQEALLERINFWNSKGIKTVGLGDEQYPARLSLIYQPPPLLFYKGDLSRDLTARVSLGIVGSRRADSFGCDLAFQFGRGVAQAGGCVVSGLALGVDAHAHRGALEGGGELPTIAVLGNGLFSVYPAVHYRLADQILNSGGLIFSQFEPDEKPYPSNFLNRNRVIAGLSQGVLVIQASQRSGSLVTARYALEEGRDVMAVPGAINDGHFSGSNNLIKQGAHLVGSLEDLWDLFPDLRVKAEAAEKKGGLESEETLSPSQQMILSALQRVKCVAYDSLAQQFSEVPSFAADLLQLELNELIVRLPGNQVALRTLL